MTRLLAEGLPISYCACILTRVVIRAGSNSEHVRRLPLTAYFAAPFHACCLLLTTCVMHVSHLPLTAYQSLLTAHYLLLTNICSGQAGGLCEGTG